MAETITAEPEKATATLWAAPRKKPGSPPLALDVVPTGPSSVPITTAARVPLVHALGDGHAVIDVPLKPGKYEFNGVPFKVKPGTVAHVTVNVKNGELVAANPSQEGTRVRITPPLDFPMQLTGKGVHVKEDEGRRKLEFDIGGFFDVSFKMKNLSEMLASGDARVPQDKGHHPLAELGLKMFDLSQVKVDAQVTMRESSVDIGGAKVGISPRTTFSVKGDGRRTTVSGHVGLDTFVLDQNGVKLASTGGKAELVATIDRTADGFAMNSQLSDADLSIDHLTAARPSLVVPGKIDKLSLGKTKINNAEIRLASKIGFDGAPRLQVDKQSLSLSFQSKGHLNDAQLTVKDAKDSASLALAGDFEGAVAIGALGMTIDGKVTGGRFDVRDLQQAIKGNQVSIEHAHADGSVRVKSSPNRLHIDGEVKNIDIVVDDFKAKAKGVETDLGRSTIQGKGTLHLGDDGLKVEGQMKATATIDSASFAEGQGKKASLGNSKVKGQLSSLSLGKGGAEMHLEDVAVDLNVKKAQLDIGQAKVSGGGKLTASSHQVVLDANGFSLGESTGNLSLKLDDGRLHSSTVDLTMTKGSSAELVFKELSLGTTSTLRLAPGSRVDVVLKSGKIKVGKDTIELEPGGTAGFAVNTVDIIDGKADLRGSLKLDAQVRGRQLKLEQFETPGFKLHPTDVTGRLQVSVDDAHLSNDTLSFQNAHAAVDLEVGKYVGAAVPGQPGVGSLQDPVQVASVESVKKSTAAQIAGVPPVAQLKGSPLGALALLRDGTVKAEIPLHVPGGSMALGLVKFPPGSRLALSLAVRDGKIITKETTLAVTGGIKVVGIEIRGAHLDDERNVHIDIKVAGKEFSVILPGSRLPTTMAEMVDPTSEKQSWPVTALGQYGDFSHARFEVTNATCAAGRIVVPGGFLEVDAGAKLSFNGTGMTGELSASVPLKGMTLSRQDLALNGTNGRGDLHLSYRRQGDKAIVDGEISNMSLSADYLTRTDPKTGDYISLGKGRINGASVSLRTEVPVNSRGLPLLEDAPPVSDARVEIPHFSGDLKGARFVGIGEKSSGLLEVGPSHAEGAVGFSQENGLTLKVGVDRLDARADDVHVQQDGHSALVDHARLKGQTGNITLGANQIAIDVQRLSWDATLKEIEHQDERAKKVRISGEGQLQYGSNTELKVTGRLHLEGGGNAQVAATAVTINKNAGISSRN